LQVIYDFPSVAARTIGADEESYIHGKNFGKKGN
jgi:hypothetical protein